MSVLVARGNLPGASCGATGNHDVIPNFAATGSDVAPIDISAVRGASDLVGVFTQPIQHATSAGTFVDPDAGGFGPDVPVTRFGDSSSATNDPAGSGAWEYPTAIAQGRWRR